MTIWPDREADDRSKCGRENWLADEDESAEGSILGSLEDETGRDGGD